MRRFGHEELADEIASYIHSELAIEISDDDGFDQAPPLDGDFWASNM